MTPRSRSVKSRLRYARPEPCNITKSVIQQLAEEIAIALNFEPGEALEPIVKKVGGKIIYDELDEAESSDDGSIIIEASGSFVIHLPPFTSARRDRFTVAHELGHYFLHFLPAEMPMKAQRYGGGRIEWEANWFAAAFLMPEKAFRAAYNEFEGDINLLSAAFAVSAKAAEVRAKSLGLSS